MAVINSAALDLTTAAAAPAHVCVCVCMHVCDELHYTSPIGLSQGPSPQFSASAQSELMKLPSADNQEN